MLDWRVCVCVGIYKRMPYYFPTCLQQITLHQHVSFLLLLFHNLTNLYYQAFYLSLLSLDANSNINAGLICIVLITKEIKLFFNTLSPELSFLVYGMLIFFFPYSYTVPYYILFNFVYLVDFNVIIDSEFF